MEIIVQWFFILGILSFLSKIYWLFKEYKNKEIVGVLKWAAIFWGLSGLLIAISVFPKSEIAKTIGIFISNDKRLYLEIVRVIVFALSIGMTLYGQYIVATAEDDQESLKEIKKDIIEIIFLIMVGVFFVKVLGFELFWRGDTP
ncbi:hypothetical protein [Succinispira mobilis]|uniref:hypothetical protein n=1 Tax=Succinispira mobilis TaxID=78120 RepID=UPI000372C359|nr:hypothetical protein [Succinispira mobilis]